MFVDVSDLINEVGVREFVSIYPVSTGYTTDEYGDMIPVSPKIISNVYSTVVENEEYGLESNSGSYVTRVVYDVYIPNKISLENDLIGATIVAKNNRKFIANRVLLSREYASHAILRCTEVKNI